MVISPLSGHVLPAEQRLKEALDCIRELRRQLQQRDELVNELRQRAAAPITGQHGALTTPAVFAAAHRVSISTVNRALNAGELLGLRQPNHRWLVYEDQPWTPKRKRGSNA